MPLVKIDILEGARSEDEIRQLANVIQQVLIEHFHAPERDRYQILTQHKPYEMICLDSGLGFTRSDKLVIIQIFHQGRDEKTKQDVYRALYQNLSEGLGLSGEDLIVTCCENTQGDWSFGMGQAQFLKGQL